MRMGPPSFLDQAPVPVGVELRDETGTRTMQPHPSSPGLDPEDRRGLGRREAVPSRELQEFPIGGPEPSQRAPDRWIDRLFAVVTGHFGAKLEAQSVSQGRSAALAAPVGAERPAGHPEQPQSRVRIRRQLIDPAPRHDEDLGQQVSGIRRRDRPAHQVGEDVSGMVVEELLEPPRLRVLHRLGSHSSFHGRHPHQRYRSGTRRRIMTHRAARPILDRIDLSQSLIRW